MGRPIKKKYFGNLNTNGVGGEGVATVVVANPTLNTAYATNATVAFSAPQIKGGTAATATLIVNTSTFKVTGITLLTAGTGYTSAPSLTITPATTGTAATFTVALTVAAASNAIAATACTTSSTAGAGQLADIVNQRSTRSYRVNTAAGAGVCRLVSTSTLAVGEMTIIASDVNGSTYYVTKLTAHKALLTRQTVSGSFEYASGTQTTWGIASASAGRVSISNN